MIRVFGTLGWLAFIAVAVAQSGCSALADLPAELPKVEPADARAAYKGALAACLVCAMPDGLPARALSASSSPLRALPAASSASNL